ncbi:MAG: ferrous iron transport protein A [Anaerolineales bacterium]|nr:MAG: ferrous iron transport protein A [Anaerolineales bacterium]
MKHRHWWHRCGRRHRGERAQRWSEDGTLPLSEMDIGETGIVVDVDGGSWVLGRLTSLGFTPGAGVRVVQNRGHGPLIARIRDIRVALGRHQARKVIVRRTVE